MKNIYISLLTVGSFLGSAGFASALHANSPALSPSSESSMMSSDMKDQKNIVQIAQSNPEFSTLVKALIAADLVTALEAQGPFTVFAPTNAAFAKLPAGTVANLLLPENKAKLVALLTYHVVPGKVMAKDVKTMEAKTLNGKDLDIQVRGSSVMVNNAKVIKTDIVGSNGVIHVIDTVLMP